MIYFGFWSVFYLQWCVLYNSMIPINFKENSILYQNINIVLSMICKTRRRRPFCIIMLVRFCITSDWRNKMFCYLYIDLLRHNICQIFVFYWKNSRTYIRRTITVTLRESNYSLFLLLLLKCIKQCFLVFSRGAFCKAE